MPWVRGGEGEEAPTKGRPREAQRGKHRPRDRQSLEDLGMEEEKRDGDQGGCSWRQSYGDTETWKKHRHKETRSFLGQDS